MIEARHESPLGVERIPISSSQLAELLEVDPIRLIGVEPDRGSRDGDAPVKGRFWIVLEPTHGDE